MDAMTKADIVRQLMQFAIDADLYSITACVAVQRCSIARRHLRVWNHKISVKKELQDGDTSACHCAMPGGISRVRRRPFRKGLRQEVAGVSCEGALHRL